MSLPVGVILPAASIGFGAIVLRPKRGIFPATGKPIIAQAVVEEDHRDDVVITTHPVEQGAAIADHAYVMPAKVVITMGWSNSPPGPQGGAGSIFSAAVGAGTAITKTGPIASIPSTIKAASSVLAGNSQDQLKAIYQQLLDLKDRREPFNLFTGKRSYKSMLIETLVAKTDETKENILWVRAHFTQVLIAETQTVTVPNNADAMKFPEQTQATSERGSVQLTDATTMTPDPASLTGSMTALSTDVLTAETTLAGMKDTTGPISELPTTLDGLQDSISSAQSKFPKPFEVPGVSGRPQSFGIALGDADLTGEQESALSELKGSLDKAKSVVVNAQKQLPTMADAPAALGSQLEAVRQRIDGTLGQVRRVTD